MVDSLHRVPVVMNGDLSKVVGSISFSDDVLNELVYGGYPMKITAHSLVQEDKGKPLVVRVDISQMTPLRTSSFVDGTLSPVEDTDEDQPVDVYVVMEHTAEGSTKDTIYGVFSDLDQARLAAWHPYQPMAVYGFHLNLMPTQGNRSDLMEK